MKMENNWKEKVINSLLQFKELLNKEDSNLFDELVDINLFNMNLVFEATKKECADKAEMYECSCGTNSACINEESILNINKPNL